MTREDAIKYLLKFAEDNKYYSDEMGFLSGLINTALSNPWHKASEELPKEDNDYLIAYRVNDYRLLDKIYMQTASFREKKWYPNAKYNGMQILAWMEIPEIKED